MKVQGVVHNWPEADREMWRCLITPASLLEDQGQLSKLRPASREVLRASYGQWVAWLRKREPNALQEDPCLRMNEARLRDWLGDLESLKPQTRLTYVSGAVRVLSLAAPERGWQAEYRIVSRLRRCTNSSPPSNKEGRILDSGVLLRLGLKCTSSHPKEKPTALEHATRVRTGTMIAMLSLMPMRVRTFAGLELGSSIIVEADKILVCPGANLLKRGVSWEAEVPEPVQKMLRQYIDETRPWLMSQWSEKHNFLWVNDRGRPYLSGHLSNTIATATKSVLGVRIATHLFRDAAATTLVRSSPEHSRLITALLGHTSLNTAEKHYIHASSIDAGRDYARLMARMRKSRN